MPSDHHLRGRSALLLACVAPGFLVADVRAVEGSGKPATPIYGVTVPDGYRDWRLIAPALEDAPLNELRAVVGNDLAVAAFRDGTLPFPDGTVLVKLAWERMPSTEFASATVPGRATTVQVMVKNTKRYAATGGWGFGRFIGGKPVDEAQHRTCFACHEARVRNRNYVFTGYAP
ncbi:MULTISPECIES: cytochrome P460 family protein [unclassified Methylobacterium]|uniref:cytochrome P460 family protein n=1 Tax=unclassified Methylobacterium TaxID=2615210 RepID=UPI0011C1E909|nr:MULTISPECIES: cytochrome P460 family protein [unclassified Methylobacterium]MCJ2116301.1 cytochrome P460 family protein [Methylobacterium sp. J-001]QEE41653.1 cytochrome C oxidase subunit III [Methylobacterium sp. WL1]TXN53858.1 cytochrome C oxidase subunit III [Methylobacterium sp. WL2]